MIDDGMTEDERDNVWQRLNHLSHVLAERDEEINRLRVVLEEVMGWIGEWSPSFVQDDEWFNTRNRVRAALNNGEK